MPTVIENKTENVEICNVEGNHSSSTISGVTVTATHNESLDLNSCQESSSDTALEKNQLSELSQDKIVNKGTDNDIILLDDDDDLDQNKIKSTNSEVNKECEDKPIAVIDLDKYEEDLINKKQKKALNRCINFECEYGENFQIATVAVLNYYRVNRKKMKLQEVCEKCNNIAMEYYDNLMRTLYVGDCLVKHEMPVRNAFVEIDSDDEDAAATAAAATTAAAVVAADDDDDNDGGDNNSNNPKMSGVDESKSLPIDDSVLEFLTDQLVNVMNTSLNKYSVEKQVEDACVYFTEKGNNIQRELDELERMHKDIQSTVDNFRRAMYANFPCKYENLEPIDIVDAFEHVPITSQNNNATINNNNNNNKTNNIIKSTTFKILPSIKPQTAALTSATASTTVITNRNTSATNNNFIQQQKRDPERRSNRNIIKPASYCELNDENGDSPMEIETIDDDSLTDNSSKQKTTVVTSGSSVNNSATNSASANNNNSGSVNNITIGNSATIISSRNGTIEIPLIPPAGTVARPKPVVGDMYYAIRTSVFGAWGKARLMEILPQSTNDPTNVMYKVRFEPKMKGNIKYVNGKQLAYAQPASVRLEVGTRVIAVFMDDVGGASKIKKESYYTGIIAEPLSPMNKFRYLVFFDDGYAQYVKHDKVLVVVHCSDDVVNDVHPESQHFIRSYLKQYPDRPMVKLQPNHVVKTEWNGKWWIARVLKVDGSLVNMYFDSDNRSEWIYRGSTRLGPLFLEMQAAANRKEGGPHIPKMQQKPKKNLPYVEYTRAPMDIDDVIPTTTSETSPSTTTPVSSIVITPSPPIVTASVTVTTGATIATITTNTTTTAAAAATVTTTTAAAAAVTTTTANIAAVAAAAEAQRVRSVARKSTTMNRQNNIYGRNNNNNSPIPVTPLTTNNMVPFLPMQQQVQQPQSKVVYFTPKSVVAPRYFLPHNCSVTCQKYIALKLDVLKGYNPLSKPLLCGFHRITNRYKGKKLIVYKTPCGRTVRNMSELHRYLRETKSDLSVDMFDFDFWVHCLAEFVLDKTYRSKRDISNGVENVPIPCVNYIDNTMPDFCNYSTRREPMEGVNLNLDPEFLCCCDCEDDCADRSKCQCWQLTIQTAMNLNRRVPDHLIGYVYKRLPESVTTGIYECNKRCKCAATCLNRVVQHPLQFKLQLFKTPNRGWGIRCLNDIPQGAFICIYAGCLLTDKMANEGGVNYGDEYLAELDYIEVVERQKEGYESDVEDDPDLNNDTADDDEDDDDDDDLDNDDGERKNKRKTMEDDDEDFEMTSEHVPHQYEQVDSTIRSQCQLSMERLIADDYHKRYRTRARKRTALSEDANTTQNQQQQQQNEDKDHKTTDDDTVTISDDEENVREPSSFAPSSDANMDENVAPLKFKSVRKYFGEDETCYIMDAKNTGNIGRFLNHSCNPNVFVQNVFVDTHDLRFPWVAFFAQNYIRAGTELTWNYNYDVGSVPGKVIFCHCGSAECRGRLL